MQASNLIQNNTQKRITMYRVIDTDTNTILNSSDTLLDITDKYLDIVLKLDKDNPKRTAIKVYGWMPYKKYWSEINL